MQEEEDKGMPNHRETPFLLSLAHSHVKSESPLQLHTRLSEPPAYNSTSSEMHPIQDVR